VKGKIIKISIAMSILLSINLHAGIAKKIGYKSIQYPDGSIKRGGHRNWRNNNPGNLEYGKFTIKNGAIGTDGRFAIFPSMKEGYKAQVALLSGDRYRNKSIRNAIHKYAPSFENNTGRYINKITSSLHVSKHKRISSLSRNQLLHMVKAMSKHEGMKSGVHLKIKQTFFQKLFAKK